MTTLLQPVERVEIHHATPVEESFRVAQVRGMFDLPAGEFSQEHFAGELPSRAATWQIGLIVGPSGSGKSSIARELFEELHHPEQVTWHGAKALLDDFPPQLDIKQITATLTAVGFSSPPSWLKPYRVLSGGERMRADLARALLDPPTSGIVVYDEFTSVVDRTVAQICSAALAKGLRNDRFLTKRFIAVSCHYDIAEWLCPDWIFDTATYKLARGSLQRPPIEITLHPADRRDWQRFSRHHYLNHRLHQAARCYIARWNNKEVGFTATLPNTGVSGMRRISRIVTLPDFQGIGIGAAMLELVATIEERAGKRVTITSSHPAMIAHCNRSPSWRCTTYRPFGSDNRYGGNNRATASFEHKRRC